MTSPTGRQTIPAVRHTDKPGCGAFTLLELIAVMVIVAVVLAMAAPDLRRFFRAHQAAHVARHLTAMAQYCRSRAVSEGRNYRLHIDPDSSRLQISRYADAGYEPAGDDLGQSYMPPDNVKVAWYEQQPVQDDNGLQFMPSGLSPVATIEVTGPGGETWFVTCASPTEPFRIVKSVAQSE